MRRNCQLAWPRSPPSSRIVCKRRNGAVGHFHVVTNSLIYNSWKFLNLYQRNILNQVHCVLNRKSGKPTTYNDGNIHHSLDATSPQPRTPAFPIQRRKGIVVNLVSTLFHPPSHQNKSAYRDHEVTVCTGTFSCSLCHCGQISDPFPRPARRFFQQATSRITSIV